MSHLITTGKLHTKESKIMGGVKLLNQLIRSFLFVKLVKNGYIIY